MRIGLIDVDGHHFPSLALMKLAAWHKSQGDTVEWWWSDLFHYDVVYMAKVFSAAYSQDVPEPFNVDRVIKGGTGYAITLENGVERYRSWMDKPLEQEMEHTYPDYSIYSDLTVGTAYGFLTRGCPRGCAFCHVKDKEGRASRQVAELGFDPYVSLFFVGIATAHMGGTKRDAAGHVVSDTPCIGTRATLAGVRHWWP